MMDDSAPWAVVGMAHGTKISLPISVLIFTAIKPFLDVCFFLEILSIKNRIYNGFRDDPLEIYQNYLLK
jgi:hypothetical protein